MNEQKQGMPCDHCGLPCHPELISEFIDGQKHNFCCRGCEGAFTIISEAGLQNFYKTRDWKQPGVPDQVFDNCYSNKHLEKFIHFSEQGAEITLLIDGIRCASCIWLIERILNNLTGVTAARVNFGTHRLTITFDNHVVKASALLSMLSRIGYLSRPYTSDAARRQEDQNRKKLLIRFGTAAFLSMQLMGYSTALYAGYFQGITPSTRQFIQIMAAVVTTPVVFFAGYPFLIGAFNSIKNRQPNMDLLVSLGSLTAYGYSIFAITQGKEVFFDTSAMIITLILIGRLMENAARSKASSAVDRLLHLAPETAYKILKNGQTEQVASQELTVGDRILVRPGDRFPVDGVIYAGSTEVDESIVSGESAPVFRKRGMKIVSGALNTLEPVEFEVSTTAAKSFLARIAHMVEKAQSQKAPIQSQADRIAVYFVPLVIILSVLTYLLGLFSGNTDHAVMNAVAVLVVACPCALGLATPTAVLVATGSAASKGILFRGGDIIESASAIQEAAFDKTGTLTQGFPIVKDIVPLNCNKGELLSLAARLSLHSAHPISKGIMHAASSQNITVKASKAKIVPGLGLKHTSEEETILAGSKDFLLQHNIIIPPLNQTHFTEVHIGHQNQYMGVIYLEDSIREEAPNALSALKRLGISLIMLTGDHEHCARNIAQKLSIDYCAKMTPDQKCQWVASRVKSGKKVLMVGDGINDAPALSAATVGCAMAGGTDIAMESSSLTLTDQNLNKLLQAVLIAKKTMRIIRQNLFWAFFYNLLMLPLAAFGYLSPIFAAMAMALSSTCVIFNSLRLRKV